ncbi:MAG: hypothetical protein AB1730_00110 [Myxococcota bacterium]
MIRLCLLCALLAASSAFADVTLTFDAVANGKPYVMTMRLKGKRMMMSMVRKDEGRDTAVLRDGEGKRTLIIDHSKKTISELSDASAAAMKDQASQAQAAMAASLASLPPEKRAQMEAMMAKLPAHAGAAGAPPPKKAYTFEKKGTSRKVNGKACEDYVVKADGVADGEGCFIAWKDAPITRESLRSQLLAASEGLPVDAQALDDSFMAETAPGLPAWRKRVDASGAVVSETTLKDLSTAAIPDAVFEAPKGYTSRSLGGGPAKP